MPADMSRAARDSYGPPRLGRPDVRALNGRNPEVRAPFEPGVAMNSPTRFAVLAFTGLSLLLGAGTARAAFLVNEIHLQYNVVDPTTGLPISTTGLKLVDLTGGHTTDPTPPLSGKFMSDASMNFGPVKLSPPNTTVDLRSLFVETNPKFHLTGFSSGEISTEVDFQFF